MGFKQHHGALVGVIFGRMIFGENADSFQAHHPGVCQIGGHHADQTAFIRQPHEIAQRVDCVAAVQHFKNIRHDIDAFGHRQPLFYFPVIDHEYFHWKAFHLVGTVNSIAYFY